MTDSQTTDASNASTDTTDAPTGTDDQGTTQTFTADYVAKLRQEAAKYRNEAKANADAASKLAEIEESQKTEAQKLADARDAALRDAESAKAEALRFRIAAKHGISEDDAATFLTGTDEESITRQAERLAELAKATGDTAPGPRPDLSQGARGNAAVSGDPAKDFANFLNGQLTR